jgi:hypothetical protein
MLKIMDKLTFENLPQAIQELHFKIDRIDRLLTKSNQQPDEDKLFDLTGLIEYLPEKPAKQTVYGWVNERFIPYEKHGKRLYFRKSAIDQWLSNGRQV